MLPLNTDSNNSNSNGDYDIIICSQSQMESFPEWRSGHPSGRQKGKRWGKGEGRTNCPQWPQEPFSSFSFQNPGKSPERNLPTGQMGKQTSQGCARKAVSQFLPLRPDQASFFPGSKKGPQFAGFHLRAGPYVPVPQRHPNMGQERVLEKVSPRVLLSIERSSGPILQLPSPLHAPTTARGWVRQSRTARALTGSLEGQTPE